LKKTTKLSSSAVFAQVLGVKEDKLYSSNKDVYSLGLQKYIEIK
jgi:hypothetical protein